MEEEKLLSSITKHLKLKSLGALVLSMLLCCGLVIKADASSNNNQQTDFNNMFKKGEEVNFYMFASFSLSDDHLRQMMDYAKTYNGVIVLRGIENNSFKKTGEHIQALAKEGEEAAIIIDPTLFKEFQVVQVPSYVLARREECPVGITCRAYYDKIIGSITPKYALEKFAAQGDLSKEAQDLLEAHGDSK
ncbi:MAG: type-F conjugative transfer system pilin assembly protein TrbC [Rickettsiales bacterium]|jgi:type-F conjugative transfer system pilin assembly protein TrbC|nr:type-F conjugative transfer system pilin assembly protein TrbC [Rickettsiales bacterium]